ncbi:MAG: vitamin K epoxide reductase family protein [Nanoarchaeota archaeon]
MNKKRGLIIILISSLIAIFTSTYLLYLHYSDTSSFCDISQGLSCDIVNRSLYSEIFGIPIALFALITFYFINVITMAALQNKKIFGLNEKNIFDIIYWLMIIGLLLALYLIYIEAFVLYSVCLLCVLLDIIILIILITIIKLRGRK